MKVSARSAQLRVFASGSCRSYSTGRAIYLTNPATEEKVQFSESADTAETVASKYQRVRAAQHASKGDLLDWKNNLKRRKAAIEKFNATLEARKEEGARLLTEDMGKPLQQARNEINGTKGRVQFFLDNVEKAVEDDVVTKKDKLQEIIKQEPLGVVANISAWNYPYFVGSNVYVPALLTGNSVLYKPSEFALRTGKFVSKLLHESGVPEDFFQPIYGDGAVGSSVLDHPVDGVFFTGSVATGQKIYQKAASSKTNLPKVQLELGGKDPTYVLPDVDIKAAVESLSDGAMYNTGQSCCSVERIYVHQSIYDKFVEEFVSVVKTFKVGQPTQDGTYIGPLVQAKQLDFLEGQVKDAVSKGARLLAGGKRIPGKGFFFEPTVLVDVNHHMSVMQDESFGPIIGIQKVSGEEEAVKLMNDTKYGLTAGVYTKDKETALRIMKQVNAGNVYWNCCDRVAVGLPWSGRNLSGLGLTLSVAGIRTFVQPKGYHLSG